MFEIFCDKFGQIQTHSELYATDILFSFDRGSSPLLFLQENNPWRLDLSYLSGFMVLFFSNLILLRFLNTVSFETTSY